MATVPIKGLSRWGIVGSFALLNGSKYFSFAYISAYSVAIDKTIIFIWYELNVIMVIGLGYFLIEV